MFYKALDTVEQIYEECGLVNLFDTLACNLTEISHPVVMKLLLRCKYMLAVRHDLIVIFKKIRRRDRCLKELNYLLVKGDQIGPHNIHLKGDLNMPSSERKELIVDKG